MSQPLNQVSLTPWTGSAGTGGTGLFGSVLTPQQIAALYAQISAQQSSPTGMMNQVGGALPAGATTDPTVSPYAIMTGRNAAGRAATGMGMPTTVGAPGMFNTPSTSFNTPAGPWTNVTNAVQMASPYWAARRAHANAAANAALAGRGIGRAPQDFTAPSPDLSADPNKMITPLDPTALTGTPAASGLPDRFANAPGAAFTPSTPPALSPNDPTKYFTSPDLSGMTPSVPSLTGAQAQPGFFEHLLNSLGGLFGNNTMGTNSGFF